MRPSATQQHSRISLLHQRDACSLMEDKTVCGASGLMEHARALILHQAGCSEYVFALLKQEAGHTLHVHAEARILCHA